MNLSIKIRIARYRFLWLTFGKERSINSTHQTLIKTGAIPPIMRGAAIYSLMI